VFIFTIVIVFFIGAIDIDNAFYSYSKTNSCKIACICLEELFCCDALHDLADLDYTQMGGHTDVFSNGLPEMLGDFVEK